MISISAAITRHAFRQPTKIAIATPNEEISYSELRAFALGLSAFIMKERLQNGVIGSIAGNSATALKIIVGARFANMQLVLLDSKMPVSELLERCTQMEVGTVFVDETVPSDTCSCLVEIGVQVVDVSCMDFPADYESSGDSQFPYEVKAQTDEPIWHGPSGGSSGVRRAIALSEPSSLFRFASQTIEFNLDRTSRFLLSAPLIHGAGRSFSVGQLHGGGTIELHPKFDVDMTLDALSRVQGAFLVPTMLSRLLQSPRWSEIAARTNTKLIISGGRLDGKLAEKASRGFAGQIFNYFGSTEAGAVSVAVYEDGEKQSIGDLGNYTVGCSGKLVDLTLKHRSVTEPGDQGRLQVATPGNCLWSLDIATRKKLMPVDGYWDHGDVVRRREDGSLDYVGRADDMIISGGVNIYPAEVLRELECSKGVIAAFVVGFPDLEWGEIVGAVIEGTSDLTLEGLRSELRARLRPAVIPKSLLILDAIPRNAMAKTDGAQINKILANAGIAWFDRRTAGGA